MTLDTLQFQGQWREYQARVLSELDSHLDDSHLHVVAAPGSGKTILGLEVLRRLGKPALIIAPSIAIRNQWIDRLTSMFMESPQNIDEWITKDIRNPKTLTFITYQALHAVFSGEEIEEEEDELEEEESAKKKKTGKKSEAAKVIRLLKEAKVNTIVLDEAHHLRKEWWSALTKLKAKLNKPSFVSLTATPPYDVSYAQWQKYEELCGPIDTEISVPELVKCGNLCPHQDYVYFSLPTKNEARKLRQFKGDIQSFLAALKVNEPFQQALGAHPWISDPEGNIEDILGEPELFSAFIIYLHSAGFTPPKHVLKILGVHKQDIPAITPDWLEILLTGVLYKHADILAPHEEILSSIRKHLKKIGAIERRKVVIDNTKEIKKLLASSLAKLDSIVDITRQEATHFGDGLRMVVLADYIRMTELPSNKSDNRPIDKIGVIPIFEYLRRAKINGLKIGVLTGSIVIIPHNTQAPLQERALQMGIEPSDIHSTPMVHDEGYLQIRIKGANRQKMVQLITDMFNQGHITALVGTQALLGEGWDAPSINTLILASHVGSFMLSNQMRGRAIRIDPNRPDKAANIWHLAALDIESMQEKFEYMLTGKTTRRTSLDPFDEIAEDLGHDLRMLRRRFRAFEGLSYNAPVLIENGFKRLGLSTAKWDKAGVQQTNQNTLDRAAQRSGLARLWSEALEGRSPNPTMREKIESNYVPRGLAFADTLKYMAMNALIGGAAYGAQIMRGAQHSENFAVFLIIGVVVALAYAAPKLLKALYLLIRNGSIEGSLKQVGWTVLETLQHMELIKTHRKKLKIETVKDKMGLVYCRIDGATNIEKRHFLEAMKEVLGPIQNARYVLVRHSYLATILRVDYHPVPKIIAANKQYATFFHKKWSRYIGNTQLIYTRTPEGRSILLKARTKSLSSAFVRKTDQVSVWE
jgi:superfamily II DNA or RNA helicase